MNTTRERPPQAYARKFTLLAGSAFFLVALVLGSYGLVGRLFAAWEDGTLVWTDLPAPVSLIAGGLMLMVAVYRDFHAGVRFNASAFTFAGMGLIFVALLTIGL